MLPWSVMARAFMPSAAAFLYNLEISAAPSSSENWV